MAIKINKQLNRPDGSKVSSGSIIKYDTRLNGKSLIVWFFLNHYISTAAFEAEKQPINSINEFKYTLYRECTPEEWAELNKAGSAELVEGWLKEVLDSEMGEGYVEIN